MKFTQKLIEQANKNSKHIDFNKMINNSDPMETHRTLHSTSAEYACFFKHTQNVDKNGPKQSHQTSKY